VVLGAGGCRRDGRERHLCQGVAASGVATGRATVGGDPVSPRGARRFVADLLRGRRPRPFRAKDSDVAELRAAITLRTARPGEAVPREEFVTDLRERLAAELSEQGDGARVSSARSAVNSRRRRLVQAGSIAAAAAAVGAVVDHTVTARSPGAES